GWTIQAVVCDGRPGVKAALALRYPIQMCHFHQVAIVRRYLTRNPLLPAGQELAALMVSLPRATEEDFTIGLAEWFQHWGDFIKERTIDPMTGRWHYTHRRIRAAYRSLSWNLPYLFTHKKYPTLGIPNTTNSLDGSISHLRDKLRAHRGIKLTERIKITEELLGGIDPKNLH
ncbi:hypothetical protein HY523_01620, partial [Candidatus Berkelbacteria bacterium]|nr:hypothetical protein [Candidatus Berkelbacteria bacterium]